MPPAARVGGGETLFEGRDLLKLSDRGMRKLLRRDIAYVPQSDERARPRSRVGDQVVEALRDHDGLGRAAADARAAGLFASVGLEARRLRDHPHRFSGGMDREAERRFRRRAQLVFQNPFDAPNPRFTIRRSLAEPLPNAAVPRKEHGVRIAEALRMGRLRAADHLLDGFPHQLSGGQLQRVALALRSEFVVADEPASMLDVSVRAGILNVLREVRDRIGLAAASISPDLAPVRYGCARAITMSLGVVVEDGPTEEVATGPPHPRTRAPVQAAPAPRVDRSRAPLPIGAGAPDAREPPSGCRFRDRCPLAAPRCAAEHPALRDVAPGRRVACRLV